MTRKVFLPGMNEIEARRQLRASVIQFWRVFSAWISEKEGIRILNTWQRDYWNPPAKVLAGLPPDSRWQAVGVAIHIGATTSALGFLEQIGRWTVRPNIRLADSRFGLQPNDSGDTLTAIFLILEENGTARMRPKLRPRHTMLFRRGSQSRPDRQEPVIGLT